MNIVVLTGRLGDDLKLYNSDNKKFGRLRLAVDRFKITKDGKEKLAPVWVTVFVHGERAEKLSQYLKRGSKISVTGSLTADKNGALSVICHRIEFLSQKKDQTIEQQVPPEITEEEPF